MRLSPPSLLAAVVLSTVAACTLNQAGLEATSTSGKAGNMAVMQPDASTAGTSGASAASGAAGNPVGPEPGSTAGASGAAGGAGDTGAAGDTMSGAAGAGTAGAGTAGVAGSGAAGQAGAEGPADAGGTAGATSQPDAQLPPPIGCADGTREGFKDLDKYPDIAACAGGWQLPGLVAANTQSPQCDRKGGNDGDEPEGLGCSVADLCAQGWHVCESAQEVAARTTDCKDAIASGGAQVFFVTRQRGPMMTCDPANETGTNNLFGCGNFGSAASAACAPFTRMLRDADCKATPPWMCVDGPIDYNVSELVDVTKPGSSHGGVLCCR